jgi:hypothetical protein
MKFVKMIANDKQGFKISWTDQNQLKKDQLCIGSSLYKRENTTCKNRLILSIISVRNTLNLIVAFCSYCISQKKAKLPTADSIADKILALLKMQQLLHAREIQTHYRKLDAHGIILVLQELLRKQSRLLYKPNNQYTFRNHNGKVENYIYGNSRICRWHSGYHY